ncbi:MAG: putative Protein phosphatase methylesterase 1 [Streblomastix strix]|uniref:Protein phosphatase methylesterase 1 n=1 Tax=Streblomastix strix TaxID=222440 RepID=A0A5J4X311_9EUKA|nr:MAG: putative Protein phosphatase methylesterase 1 [Streblomastix strix]
MESALDYFDEQVDVEVRGGIFRTYKAGNGGAVCVLIHGVGLAAVSWALLGNLIKKKLQVLAIDLRGHGDTHFEDETDQSLETHAEDVVSVVNKLYPSHNEGIILVGHSMGGAIAVQIAVQNRLQSQLKGLILIEAVEGTALDSLPGMENLLNQRPAQFETIENACIWAASNLVKKPQALRVSAPFLFKEIDDGQSKKYTWRIPLIQTKPYWKGWYSGLGGNFLSVKCPKVLCVADLDRLDTPMSIAQMQGKFQFNIIPNSGHHVQEEEPEKVSNIIIGFAERYGFQKGAQPRGAIGGNSWI